MSDFQTQDALVQPEVQAEAALQQAEPGTQATEASEQENSTPVEKRTYSEEELQDRIERATAKAAAKAERRAYREALASIQRPQEVQQPQVNQRPSRRDGESDDVYLERLADWKLDQRDQKAQQERQQEQNRNLASKTERLYADASKLPGFDREEFDSLPLTPQMAAALVDADEPAKLMAYMSANPADVQRIAGLSPAKQAVEIGKLEARITASASSTASKAPPPITPVGSRGTAVQSLEEASLDDYARMRAKQGASWARRLQS